VVGRAGTGVDNIDLQAATRKGVIVLKYVYDFILLSAKKLGRIDFDIYYEAITALLKCINLKQKTSILYEKIIKIRLATSLFGH